MIVVADTTPLLYLSRIGRVAVLQALYEQIIVPKTVWEEAVLVRPNAKGIEDLLGAHWLVVSDQAERTGVDHALEQALDPGEAAAITLAEFLRAEILLIDERKGRMVARERGLKIRGTLGVLVDAAELGTSGYSEAFSMSCCRKAFAWRQTWCPKH